MNVQRFPRPSAGESDLQAMFALANRFPAENLHVVDLPYRFSSWALDDPANSALWEDAGGELLGWAVLQTPFWALDYVYHPAAPELHREILAWADRRACAIVGSPQGRPMWFVNVFAGQADRIRELEAAGWASQADVPENPWSKLFLARPGDLPAPAAPLPPGFTLRSLAGPSEVAAYVALHRTVFNSTSMTTAWRARTLAHPAYRAHLDLVAVAPDGRLAGFCIGWLNPRPGDTSLGQVEPLGVHPDFRGLGLGRALLSLGLSRLQAYAPATVLVETDHHRTGALSLYAGCGFRKKANVIVYRKDYP